MRRQPCARRVLCRARASENASRVANLTLRNDFTRADDSLSSGAQVEEEAGVRSTLGADLGTFYDMDKATVTVIFTMTVEEVRNQPWAWGNIRRVRG